MFIFQELKLLKSGDPQYAHFAIPLYVDVELIASPHIVYERIVEIIETLSNQPSVFLTN